MSVTSMFRGASAKRIAVSAMLSAAAALGQGCLMEPASGESTQASLHDPEAGAKTLQEQSPASSNGIPVGCNRQWNATARDSVLFCPDIRPPKP